MAHVHIKIQYYDCNGADNNYQLSKGDYLWLDRQLAKNEDSYAELFDEDTTASFEMVQHVHHWGWDYRRPGNANYCYQILNLGEDEDKHEISEQVEAIMNHITSDLMDWNGGQEWRPQHGLTAVRRSIRIPPDLDKIISYRAEALGITYSAYVIRVLAQIGQLDPDKK